MESESEVVKDLFEKRLQILEGAIRRIIGMNEDDHWTDDGIENNFESLVKRVEVLEDKVRNLELEVVEKITALINEKSAQLGNDAVAAAEDAVKVLSAKLEEQIIALQTKTSEELLARIDEVTAQARGEAVKTAQEVMIPLANKIKEQTKKHEDLSRVVEEIRNPKPADEIAKTRTEEYRKFLKDGQPEKLKKSLAEERLDVLVEVVSKLDFQENPNDHLFLTDLLKLVDDQDRVIELVSFAGTKVKRKTA